MRPQLDLRVAELAERQHGVVGHAQLLEFGLGRRGISHRMAAGRLHHLHRGAYAVGRPGVSSRGWWMAAVLACGPRAALSHRSAAALWGLWTRPAGRVHVVVPSQAGRAQPLVVVHRCASLVAEEVTERDGIAVTTVARTLLDVARTERRRMLHRCVEAAVRERVFDLADVDALLLRHRARPGTRRLAAAVDVQRDEPAFTRSELERRFLELARDAGVPTPSANATVLGYEVDFSWPEERLVVEIDTLRHHGDAAAFERDRRRDADLAVAGWQVVRFTDRAIAPDPSGVRATLRALVAQRGAALRPAGRPAS